MANICCQLSFSLKTSLDNSQADSVDVKGKVDEPKLQEIKDMRIIGLAHCQMMRYVNAFRKNYGINFSANVVCQNIPLVY